MFRALKTDRRTPQAIKTDREMVFTPLKTAQNGLQSINTAKNRFYALKPTKNRILALKPRRSRFANSDPEKKALITKADREKSSRDLEIERVVIYAIITARIMFYELIKSETGVSTWETHAARFCVFKAGVEW